MARVAPERFRRFLRENTLADRDGRSWRITDSRPRQVEVLTNGERQVLTVIGHEQLSLNGKHRAAVKAFLSSNDVELLLPFAGRSVTDVKGRDHPLETDPNRLHRIAAQGEGVFHEIYRLII